MKVTFAHLVFLVFLLGSCKSLDRGGQSCGVWLIDLEPVAKRETAKILPLLKVFRESADKEMWKEIEWMEKKGIPYENLWFVVKPDKTWRLFWGNSGEVKAKGGWSWSGDDLFLSFSKEMESSAHADSFFPFKEFGLSSKGVEGKNVNLGCKGFVFRRTKNHWVAHYAYRVKVEGGRLSETYSPFEMPVKKIYP